MIFRVFRQGARSEEFEEDFIETDTAWDSLEAEYLLASLPQSCIARFVQECELVANKFELSIYRSEHQVSTEQLQIELNGIANELSNTHGDPGSEWLAITIQMTYPRRPKA